MILLASDMGAFIGRLHPLVVHLPIGFITLAAIMYFFSANPKHEKLRNALSFVLLLASLSAFLSAFLGWLLAGNGAYNPSVMTLHKWSGFVLAPLSLIAWWQYSKNFRINERPRYLSWIIYGMFAILLFNGHQGGSLTHGKNFLFEKAPGPIAALFGIQKTAEKTLLPSTDPDSVYVFNQIIHPFLIQRCKDCHNKEAAEGDLVLTTLEGIKKGGADGAAVVGGDLKKSGIFQRTIMPQSDERFMPTGGKTPLTFNQIRILEWWISQGADFEGNLTSIPAPEDIRQLLEKEYGIPAKALDFVDKVKIVPLAEADIAKASESGFNIAPLAPDHPLLDIKVTKNDFDLQALLSLRQHITWLDLSELDLQGKNLDLIGQFENLTRLKMDRCSLSKDSLKFLSELSNLEYLNLYGNNLENGTLVNIGQIRNLKKLFVWQNKFTPEALTQLQNTLPALEINNGFEFKDKTS